MPPQAERVALLIRPMGVHAMPACRRVQLPLRAALAVLSHCLRKRTGSLPTTCFRRRLLAHPRRSPRCAAHEVPARPSWRLQPNITSACRALPLATLDCHRRFERPTLRTQHLRRRLLQVIKVRSVQGWLVPRREGRVHTRTADRRDGQHSAINGRCFFGNHLSLRR